MILTIILVLIALWAFGFLAELGGNLIHLLLVVALAVVVYRLVFGHRGV